MYSILFIPMTHLLRAIDKTDYDKQYVQLMQVLASTNAKQITREMFDAFICNTLSETHRIFVIEDTQTNRIIGSATVIIEQKIIHTMGKVAHIEDVVVHPEYRGKKLGKLLVGHITELAIANDCYKTILDCSAENVIFYEQCGFSRKGFQMGFYH